MIEAAKPELLNKYLASVFTYENVDGIPEFVHEISWHGSGNNDLHRGTILYLEVDETKYEKIISWKGSTVEVRRHFMEHMHDVW